jgi:hypothetical protein
MRRRGEIGGKSVPPDNLNSKKTTWSEDLPTMGAVDTNKTLCPWFTWGEI